MPPLSDLHFPNGATQAYYGRGPFYFGLQLAVGDWNKNPWAIGPGYTSRVTVAGHRVDGAGVVNFGYWPTGYGTPSQLSDVPVSFTRNDSQGQTVVFQAELRAEQEPGGSHWRLGAGFWSFPDPGCYVIQARGVGLDETAKVRVG
jgi:hypothetical protein